MDVAAQWLTSEKHLIDTSIRSVFAGRGQHAQAHFLPETAARLGERQKLDHCGNCVCPVISGQERRLGQRGLPTLNLLAREARDHGKPKPGSASPGAPQQCFLRTVLEDALVAHGARRILLVLVSLNTQSLSLGVGDSARCVLADVLTRCAV